MSARPSHLVVLLYGSRVATLSEDSQGRLALRWHADATARWPINSTVLSVQLPLTPSSPPPSARARAFFAGLLPEGEARIHLATEAGVAPDDVFGMLAAYGRDVAGALDIAPAAADSSRRLPELVPADPATIRARLERADSNDAPLGVLPGVTSRMRDELARHTVADTLSALASALSNTQIAAAHPGVPAQALTCLVERVTGLLETVPAARP